MAVINSYSDFSFKCHFCPVCDGTGCIGEIPGMGGNHNNENFRLNCDGWEVVRKKLLSNAEKCSLKKTPLLGNLPGESFLGKSKFSDSTGFAVSEIENPDLRKFLSLAPISGAVENVGYHDEKSFYKDIIEASWFSKIDISIGDGCPDLKILGAIEAVKSLSEKYKNESPDNSKIMANVFMKPYENVKIFERMEWADDVAKTFGVDIDSFNIATMKYQVVLEKKGVAQLLELKKHSNQKGRPFAIKGIFTESDVDLVKEVRPDVVYISNHGGRVETRTGSTAEFFYNYADVLKNYCNEIWIDGGIRTKENVETALHLGAKKILLGRPIITALCDGLKNCTDAKENVNEAVIRLAS